MSWLLVDSTSGQGKVLQVEEEKKDELQVIVGRVGEEIASWREYATMEHKQERHKHLAFQEFQHAVIAMADLIQAMQKCATPEELIELQKLGDTLSPQTHVM